MTKIYIQENETYQLSDMYSGHTKHIEFDRNSKKVRLFVHSLPCCDSYTHNLVVYELSDKGKRILKERILFLDPNGRNFRGIPQFSRVQPVLLNATTKLCIR